MSTLGSGAASPGPPPGGLATQVEELPGEVQHRLRELEKIRREIRDTATPCYDGQNVGPDGNVVDELYSIVRQKDETIEELQNALMKMNALHVHNRKRSARSPSPNPSTPQPEWGWGQQPSPSSMSDGFHTLHGLPPLEGGSRPGSGQYVPLMAPHPQYAGLAPPPPPPPLPSPSPTERVAMGSQTERELDYSREIAHLQEELRARSTDLALVREEVEEKDRQLNSVLWMSKVNRVTGDHLNTAVEQDLKHQLEVERARNQAYREELNNLGRCMLEAELREEEEAARAIMPPR